MAGKCLSLAGKHVYLPGFLYTCQAYASISLPGLLIYLPGFQLYSAIYSAKSLPPRTAAAGVLNAGDHGHWQLRQQGPDACPQRCRAEPEQPSPLQLQTRHAQSWTSPWYATRCDATAA